jgi:hypothetical protein
MAASTTEAPAEDRFALHLAVWDDDADRLQALLMTGKYGESCRVWCCAVRAPLLLAIAGYA